MQRLRLFLNAFFVFVLQDIISKQIGEQVSIRFGSNYEYDIIINNNEVKLLLKKNVDSLFIVYFNKDYDPEVYDPYQKDNHCGSLEYTLEIDLVAQKYKITGLNLQYNPKNCIPPQEPELKEPVLTEPVKSSPSIKQQQIEANQKVCSKFTSESQLNPCDIVYGSLNTGLMIKLQNDPKFAVTTISESNVNTKVFAGGKKTRKHKIGKNFTRKYRKNKK
jgi:hypothetical protein